MTFSQDDRPLKVKTPLGKDVLLLQSFNGEEGISQLFQFRLELLAENQTDVPFDKLLGQKVTVSIKLAEGERHISGICNRVSQGGRDATLTRYCLEMVPQFWLLTRRVQCRIFQQETVPDILKKVLDGLDVAFEIRGEFPKRDYCVQYRESDFAFACRMMEAEGIYYFFKHTAEGHQLVVANTPQSHADVAPAKAIYEELEGGNRKDDRIHGWRKLQELRSGKVTLWDTYFEMPQKHLEAEKVIQDSVAVGKVTHKLKVAGNDKLELYDYPGGYAEWFDGVAPGGGDNASSLGKLFQENQRVVAIRMQEEAVHSLTIDGESTCGQFTAGLKFTLERHFNADGAYVLTQVSHRGSLPDYRTGQSTPMTYDNSFKCIPAALPFRPARHTEEPLIHGTQTAIVVGPPGETIHPDKYGRVKVQFLWDRAWKKNGESSCWIRVSQSWGGGTWGGMNIPHVGQEVIVAFEEGDPDRPVIVGRVYNAEQMPPLELPANKTKSAIRDHGGNEIIMEGDGGKQQMRLFSPTHNTYCHLGNSITWNSTSFWDVTIGGYEKVNITEKSERTIGKDAEHTVKGAYTEKVTGNYWEQILSGDVYLRVDTGEYSEIVQSHYHTTVNAGDMTVRVKGGVYDLETSGNIRIHAGGVYRRTASHKEVEVAKSASLKFNLMSSSEVTAIGKGIVIGGLKSENILGGEVKKLGPYKSENVHGWRKSHVTATEILKAAKVEVKAAAVAEVKAPKGVLSKVLKWLA